MRVLLIVSVLSLLLYVVTLPACQYRALQKATTAAEQGRFDEAWTRVLPLLQEKPAFFSDRAKALCGQIGIQQARTLATGTNPDFSEAARLLLSLADRCQGPEKPEVRPLLEKVADLHLAHATARCRHKDYADALSGFQQISTLPYPERFLLEAKSEAGWCRLTMAQELAERQWFAEALEELVRAMGSGDSTVRKAALTQVPSLVEKEVAYWLAQMQYIRAFEVLTQRRQSFGGEPEVALFFPRLESLVEMQVFGMVLTQPCLGKPKKIQGQKSVPVVEVVAASPSGYARTNLTVQNNMAYDLQILLRGPEQDALRLKPKEKKPLWLEPGDYAVGMFAPGQCEVKPKHTSWKVEPFVHHTIEVLLQD